MGVITLQCTGLTDVWCQGSEYSSAQDGGEESVFNQASIIELGWLAGWLADHSSYCQEKLTRSHFKSSSSLLLINIDLVISVISTCVRCMESHISEEFWVVCDSLNRNIWGHRDHN